MLMLWSLAGPIILIRIGNSTWVKAPDFMAPKFDDHLWRTLELPHDWSIEGEFDQSNPVKSIKRRTVMDSKVGFWQ